MTARRGLTLVTNLPTGGYESTTAPGGDAVFSRENVDALLREQAEQRERAYRKADLLRDEQKRRLADQLDRHGRLTALHRDHPVLVALLVQHTPHPDPVYTDPGLGRQCHACPGAQYAGSLFRQPWPCPTWTAIAAHTTSEDRR